MNLIWCKIIPIIFNIILYMYIFYIYDIMYVHICLLNWTMKECWHMLRVSTILMELEWLKS